MQPDARPIAKIRHAHGVRGEVKLASFTTPPELIFTLPLKDATGVPVKLTRTGVQKDLFLCRIEGVTDRNVAETLKGREFFAEAAALPALAPHQRYVDELIGLRVVDASQAAIGTVRDIVNYGASDIVVIDTPTGELMLPYAAQFFPEDAKDGVLVCALPEIIAGEKDT